MGWYTDPQFQSSPVVMVAFEKNIGTATITASGHAPTIAAVVLLPKFAEKTQIKNFKALVITAPGANATQSKLILKNGTNTAGVVTVGTNTAGADLDAAMTAANALFAAGVAPTIDFQGTGTASANAAAGVYSIYFEVQEAYQYDA